MKFVCCADKCALMELGCVSGSFVLCSHYLSGTGYELWIAQLQPNNSQINSVVKKIAQLSVRYYGFLLWSLQYYVNLVYLRFCQKVFL